MIKKIVFVALTSLLIFTTAHAQQSSVKIVVNADLGKDIISKNIYGQFSEHLGRCIYEGIWVGENSDIPNTRGIRNDVLEALKKVGIPNLRWPGGCFADEYHWRDGIGPREQRPKMINTHWGGVVEDNSFGTHEFLDFCELLGTEPYICGNLGSGTVEEMSKWVEYLNFDGESPMSNLRRLNGREKPWDIKYWCVGNENWGCGGNMTAEFYADQYKRYATYCRDYAGNRILKVASGGRIDDYEWIEVLMKEIPWWLMGGVSMHYYTVPQTWEVKGSATVFDEKEYFHTIRKCTYTEDYINRYSAIMDQYDPQKRVALIVDEWGNWFDVEPGSNPGFLYQQNTLRDAITAATSLNIFNNHCDRVKMANIAQMVNVLHALILTDGSKMILTPTYHVFDMFKVHHDAVMIPVSIKTPNYECDGYGIPSINASASKDKNGVIHITLVNITPSTDLEIECELRGADMKNANSEIITAKEITSHNTFENQNEVVKKEFDGFSLKNDILKINMPAKSVVMIAVK